jgi:hypothetical protein
MSLLRRREGLECEVLELQRLLDEDRAGHGGELRRADAGDLTERIIYLARAIRQALLETERLKQLGST